MDLAQIRREESIAFEKLKNSLKKEINLNLEEIKEMKAITENDENIKTELKHQIKELKKETDKIKKDKGLAVQI